MGYFTRNATVRKNWFVIDALDAVLGRLASQITKLLRGKNKVYYTPHVNCGDNVVVINAKKIKLTGDKLYKKNYYRYTNHPGGLRKVAALNIKNGLFPERILKNAVTGMMPKESSLA